MDVKAANSAPWISSLTVYTIITFAATLLGLMYLKRYRFIQRCDKIAGPSSNMPILAVIRLLFFTPDEFLRLVLALQTIWSRFTKSGITCAWVGPIPFFFATTAESAEMILGSTKHISKSNEYKYLHPWLNTGLLTSTGSKWQSRRKLLTPAFHFKILEDFVTVFNEQSRILVGKLRQVASNKDNDFDIFPYVTRCTLDIICESAMGKNVEAQSKIDSDYVKAVYMMSGIAQIRQVRFYLQPEWIFRLTSYWSDQLKSLKILHGFTDQVIHERKLYHQQSKLRSTTNVKTLHDSAETDDFFPKRRLAFLDLLIEASQDGTVLNDRDIREEVDTFMFEGHDTTSAAIAWSIFLIGSCPRIQDLVNEELNRVFQDSDRPITMNDLSELKYMECCIKEALRLYPSVPVYGRQLAEDTVIGGDEIPSGQSVFVCPFFLHRDPRYFPNPELYQPERFLAENSVKRHPYAYIPFSAGPRNCIGQRFALMEEKCVLASIFRNFHVKSLDKREEIVLMAELILRPRDGIRVQLIPK